MGADVPGGVAPRLTWMAGNAQQAGERRTEQMGTGEMSVTQVVRDSTVVEHAKVAAQQKRRMFIVQLDIDNYDEASSKVRPGLTRILEGIEETGWRLDQITPSPDEGGAASRLFIFRPEAAGGQQAPGYPRRGSRRLISTTPPVRSRSTRTPTAVTSTRPGSSTARATSSSTSTRATASSSTPVTGNSSSRVTDSSSPAMGSSTRLRPAGLVKRIRP